MILARARKPSRSLCARISSSKFFNFRYYEDPTHRMTQAHEEDPLSLPGPLIHGGPWLPLLTRTNTRSRREGPAWLVPIAKAWASVTSLLSVRGEQCELSQGAATSTPN